MLVFTRKYLDETVGSERIVKKGSKGSQIFLLANFVSILHELIALTPFLHFMGPIKNNEISKIIKNVIGEKSELTHFSFFLCLFSHFSA